MNKNEIDFGNIEVGQPANWNLTVTKTNSRAKFSWPTLGITAEFPWLLTSNLKLMNFPWLDWLRCSRRERMTAAFLSRWTASKCFEGITLRYTISRNLPADSSDTSYKTAAVAKGKDSSCRTRPLPTLGSKRHCRWPTSWAVETTRERAMPTTHFPLHPGLVQGWCCAACNENKPHKKGKMCLYWWHYRDIIPLFCWVIL